MEYYELSPNVFKLLSRSMLDKACFSGFLFLFGGERERSAEFMFSAKEDLNR